MSQKTSTGGYAKIFLTKDKLLEWYYVTRPEIIYIRNKEGIISRGPRAPKINPWAPLAPLVPLISPNFPKVLPCPLPLMVVWRADPAEFLYNFCLSPRSATDFLLLPYLLESI